jgi:hypothetical protein
MKNLQTDEHGAPFEEMPGEREAQDGDGDKKFIVDDSLVASQAEIDALCDQIKPG